MSTIQKPVDKAPDLPEEQKLTLANRVLELTEPPVTNEVADAWDTGLQARVRAYDVGRSRTRPAGDVFRDVNAELPS